MVTSCAYSPGVSPVRAHQRKRRYGGRLPPERQAVPGEEGRAAVIGEPCVPFFLRHNSSVRQQLSTVASCADAREKETDLRSACLLCRGLRAVQTKELTYVTYNRNKTGGQSRCSLAPTLFATCYAVVVLELSVCYAFYRMAKGVV